MPVIEENATSLLKELKSARAESDRLFAILTPDAMYDRPIEERHRVIFYLGHLDGFDAIQICREGLGMRTGNEAFDKLFQAGIDPDADDLPRDTPEDWPSLKEVRDYVERCRTLVDRNLEHASGDVAAMALEHRLMHLETLAYMFHNFEYSRKNVQMAVPTQNSLSSIQSSRWLTIPAGQAILGKPRDGVFGWDNEYEETRCPVPEFLIQQRSVTNGDYLAFVKEGAPPPHFWSKRNGKFFYRGMFEEIELPLDWPVYVTQEEAVAYASSNGKSLMSEAQFHRAAYGTPEQTQRYFPWGPSEPSSRLGNFNFQRWDPESVLATPDGDSAFGVGQLVGNGWEWTSTVFAPFPGFEIRPSYPGYSSNFFDGKHYVMKGGSCRTAGRLLRRTFRNWFRGDYPYTYAKFRCVEN